MALKESQGNFAARLSHLYGNIRNCFQAGTELDRLDTELQNEVATGLGRDRHQLLDLNCKASAGAQEMEQLMQALHIDPVEVRISAPIQFREMQLTCLHCPSKGQCRHDLDAKKAPENFASYCSNSGDLNSLRAQPELLAE